MKQIRFKLVYQSRFGTILSYVYHNELEPDVHQSITIVHRLGVPRVESINQRSTGFENPYLANLLTTVRQLLRGRYFPIWDDRAAIHPGSKNTSQKKKKKGKKKTLPETAGSTIDHEA